MLTRALLALCLASFAYSFEYSYENRDRDYKDFCRGYPCPTYRVLESKQYYELRQYDEITWARTGDQQTTFGWWWDLFWYFHKSNVDHVKIPMGLPIGKEFSLTSDMKMGENTGLAFYVNTTSPPEPYSKEIEIRHVPAGSKYYVRSFSEYATRSVISRELDRLIRAIPDNADIEETVFYLASYQTPMFFQWSDFHYEIIVLKND